MDRKYSDFEAKHGPLFKNLKHKDRLNFEDSSLATDKWTTKVCKGTIEAMPIILEQDEIEVQDDDLRGEVGESSNTKKAASFTTFVTSMLESSNLLVESVSDMELELNEEFSCIFSNDVASSHSLPEIEFESIYSNDSSSNNNFECNQMVSIQPLESSSDEEIDEYFKLAVSLPKKKCGQIFCHLPSIEAKTELISSPENNSSSTPSSSQAREVSKTAITVPNSEATSSDCDTVLGTMEGDFSDICYGEHLISISTTRVSRPLNLRYASEELDQDSVALLSHTTSFMNILIGEDVSSLLVDIVGNTLNSSEENSELSNHPVCSQQQTTILKTPLIINENQNPSCSASASGEASSSSQSTQMQKSGKVAKKGRMRPKSWWKLMKNKLKSISRGNEDEDSEDRPPGQ